MFKRIILLSLGSGLLIACTGCCGFWNGPLFGRPVVMDGCGPCDGEFAADCGPSCRPVRERAFVARGYGQCAAPCETDCGPACGPSCEPGCGPCATACGPSCGPPCGFCGAYGPCGCFHPLRFIVNAFRPPYWCGPMGSEVYWGEFHSDPPDCWDPCDSNGNWTGRRGCLNCNGGPSYTEGVPEPSADPEAGVPDAPAQKSVRPAPPPQPTKATRSSYYAPANSSAYRSGYNYNRSPRY